MARNSDRGYSNNTYSNNNSSNNDYGTENFGSGRYGSSSRNPFYEGDRDEGRPRQAQRNRGRFSEEEHLRNANDSAGARAARSQSYRPSGDWNGYDDGSYTSSYEADQGRNRDTGARTYGHTAYGSGRYETDYGPRNMQRGTAHSGGYDHTEREEYNRFDQDHDEHGYSHRGRSWTVGDGLEPQRPHGELYGSTYGETDHGRSRFRSADDDWHLPTPPHNDELERYNNRYGAGRYGDNAPYGTGGRGYSTQPARPLNKERVDDEYYGASRSNAGSSRYGNRTDDNRGSNTTGASYGRSYNNRWRDMGDID